MSFCHESKRLNMNTQENEAFKTSMWEKIIFFLIDDQFWNKKHFEDVLKKISFLNF